MLGHFLVIELLNSQTPSRIELNPKTAVLLPFGGFLLYLSFSKEYLNSTVISHSFFADSPLSMTNVSEFVRERLCFLNQIFYSLVY